jgi:hypothetical protein
MRIEIEFDTKGEAFFKSPYGEPARIVRMVATLINAGDKQGGLTADDGTAIGMWRVTEPDDAI